MAEVKLANITKRFGDFTVVKSVDMDIEDGKFTVLVGPSGCGKTTTLRMVAGLEEITERMNEAADAEVMEQAQQGSRAGHHDPTCQR